MVTCQSSLHCRFSFVISQNFRFHLVGLRASLLTKHEISSYPQFSFDEYLFGNAAYYKILNKSLFLPLLLPSVEDKLYCDEKLRKAIDC